MPRNISGLLRPRQKVTTSNSLMMQPAVATIPFLLSYNSWALVARHNEIQQQCDLADIFSPMKQTWDASSLDSAGYANVTTHSEVTVDLHATWRTIKLLRDAKFDIEMALAWSMAWVSDPLKSILWRGGPHWRWGGLWYQGSAPAGGWQSLGPKFHKFQRLWKGDPAQQNKLFYKDILLRGVNRPSQGLRFQNLQLDAAWVMLFYNDELCFFTDTPLNIEVSLHFKLFI